MEHAHRVQAIFDVGRVDVRADVPERALRFGAMQVVAPRAGGWSIDFVEEDEHVALHRRISGHRRPRRARPHLEIPGDRALRIDGVQSDVVQPRHRRRRRRRLRGRGSRLKQEQPEHRDERVTRCVHSSRETGEVRNRMQLLYRCPTRTAFPLSKSTSMSFSLVGIRATTCLVRVSITAPPSGYA